MLIHVLTTERDGGGHVVSCTSSHLNELYDLNGCFATVKINYLYLEDCIIFKHYRFTRKETLILSDLLRANLEMPTHLSQAVLCRRGLKFFFPSGSVQNVFKLDPCLDLATSAPCGKMEFAVAICPVATTRTRQLGSHNSDATTGKRQLGSDNSEATTWKRQLGSDNSEATTWKRQLGNILRGRGEFKQLTN